MTGTESCTSTQPLLPAHKAPTTSRLFYNNFSMDDDASTDEADNLIINPSPSLPSVAPRRRRTRSVVSEREVNGEGNEEDEIIKSAPTYETDDCTSSIEEEPHSNQAHQDSDDDEGEGVEVNEIPDPLAAVESNPSAPPRGRTSSSRRRRSDDNGKEQQQDPSTFRSTSSREHSPDPPTQQQICWGWQKLSEVLISSPTKSAVSDPPADFNAPQHFTFHHEDTDAEAEEEHVGMSKDRRRRKKKNKMDLECNENSKKNLEKEASMTEAKLENSNEEDDDERQSIQLVTSTSTDVTEGSVEVYLNDNKEEDQDNQPPTDLTPPISPTSSTSKLIEADEELLLKTPNDCYLATPTALSSFSTARTCPTTPSSSIMSMSAGSGIQFPQGIQVPALEHEHENNQEEDGFETHPLLKQRKEKKSSSKIRMKKMMRKQKSLPTPSKSLGSTPSTPCPMRKCTSSSTITTSQQDLLQVNPPPPTATTREECLPPSIQSQCNILTDQAATHEEEHGDYKSALSCLQSALSLTNHQPHKTQEDEIHQAAILHRIGVLHWKIGSYNDSLRVLYYSLDIYRHILIPRLSASNTTVIPSTGEEYNYEANIMAEIMNSLGRVYLSKGEYEQAMKFYQESLKILKNVYDTSPESQTSTHPPVVNINHPIIAQTTINIGMVYAALGKYKRSMRYYREGLRAQRVCLGNHHVDVATTLNSIGSVHEKAENNDGNHSSQALECYREALQIYRANLGNDHVDVAVTLNNIGQVYHHSVEERRHEEAMSMYVEALRIMKNVLGPTHRNVAATYHNIAQLHVVMDGIDDGKKEGKREENIEKALKIYKDVFKVQRASLGDEHVDVAVTLDSMAYAHECLKRYDKAIKCYGKALRVRRAALGKKHIFVGVTLDRMGTFHLEKDCNFKEAIRRYREALDIYQFNSVGENDGRVLNIVRNIEVVSGLIKQQKQGRLQRQEVVKETRPLTKTRSTKKSIKRMSSSLSSTSSRKSFSSKAVTSPLSNARKGKHRRSHATLEVKG